MQGTKETIRQLSELTGIPIYYDVEFFDLNKARNGVRYPSLLTVYDQDGNSYPYMDRNMRFDNPNRNIKAVRFTGTEERTVNDFGYEVKFIKKTRICEGGGWTSEGGIYEVAGIQFEM